MLSRPRDSSRWWRLGMYSFTSSPNTPSEKKIVKKNWWQLGTLTFIWQYTIFMHTYTHACIYVHTHTQSTYCWCTAVFTWQNTHKQLCPSLTLIHQCPNNTSVIVVRQQPLTHSSQKPESFLFTYVQQQHTGYNVHGLAVACHNRIQNNFPLSLRSFNLVPFLIHIHENAHTDTWTHRFSNC